MQCFYFTKCSLLAGFAGQSNNLSTNHLIQCLSQHVNELMDVRVIRPDAGTLTLKVKVSEALQ